ncbi:hypothetical protein KGM_201766 [Danaus plexippus plexippus]|uniref:Metallo-beta-lactamase domain-containing protein 1 n=1 Tax=Danaus plexippus plexippus TaxID=278856 RepID=A0A212FJX1_DANPL|nr:hypothetical protein KGM_201766 [Danaus plexippus plexippus]
MTPWDANKIISALTKHGLTAENIDYVISTHGHSDHIGNNNLFLKAKHIVGFSISFQDNYYIHPFDEGKEFIIDEHVKVLPTPGHTLSDVSVLVTNPENVVIAVTGDLFEKFEDIADPSLWIQAGSEDQLKQRRNRSQISELAEWIIPGHGPKFKVTDEIRKILREQIEKQIF